MGSWFIGCKIYCANIQSWCCSSITIIILWPLLLLLELDTLISIYVPLKMTIIYIVELCFHKIYIFYNIYFEIFIMGKELRNISNNTFHPTILEVNIAGYYIVHFRSPQLKCKIDCWVWMLYTLHFFYDSMQYRGNY